MALDWACVADPGIAGRRVAFERLKEVTDVIMRDDASLDDQVVGEVFGQLYGLLCSLVASGDHDQPEILRVVDDLAAFYDWRGGFGEICDAELAGIIRSLIGHNHLLAGFALVSIFWPSRFIEFAINMMIPPSRLLGLAACPEYRGMLCCRKIILVFPECIDRSNVSTIIGDLLGCADFFHMAIHQAHSASDPSGRCVMRSLRTLGGRCLDFALHDELHVVLQFFLSTVDSPLEFPEVTRIILNFPFDITEANPATQTAALLELLNQTNCPFAVEIMVLQWAVRCFDDAQRVPAMQVAWNTDMAQLLLDFTKERSGDETEGDYFRCMCRFEAILFEAGLIDDPLRNDPSLPEGSDESESSSDGGYEPD
jgi:hypothetical protein